MSDKTHEIPATQTLGEGLALSGQIFTLDTCVKKTLSLAIDHNKGHGRVKISIVETFIPTKEELPKNGHPLVKAVIKMTREVTHKRKGMAEKSRETVWWISTVNLNAHELQMAIRGD